MTPGRFFAGVIAKTDTYPCNAYNAGRISKQPELENSLIAHDAPLPGKAPQKPYREKYLKC